MNISLILTFEVITFLLVVGVIVQISTLYRKTATQQLHFQKRVVAVPRPKGARSKKSKNSGSTNKTYRCLNKRYPKHGLPLAEVSFSESLPLPEVTYSPEGDFSKEKNQTKHKEILSSYIDDFFFESSPAFFHVADVVELKNYQLSSSSEAEFITVSDHNVKIKGFDSLKKSAC